MAPAAMCCRRSAVGHGPSLQAQEWQGQNGEARALPLRDQPARLYSAVNAQMAAACSQVGWIHPVGWTHLFRPGTSHS